MNRVSLLVIALAATTLFAQPPQPPADWESWRFLLGKWDAVGSGFAPHPNANADSFSFVQDVQNSVLVYRRNQMAFGFDAPPIHHDDMTIIYREGDAPLRGIRWDNHGNVQQYSVGFSPSGDSLMMTGYYQSLGRYERDTFIRWGTDSLMVRHDYLKSISPDYLMQQPNVILAKRRPAH